MREVLVKRYFGCEVTPVGYSLLFRFANITAVNLKVFTMRRALIETMKKLLKYIISTNDGQRAQMRHHGYENEIADDIIVI